MNIHVRAINQALHPDAPVQPARAAEILREHYRFLDDANRDEFVHALIFEAASLAALNRNLKRPAGRQPPEAR